MIPAVPPNPVVLVSICPRTLSAGLPGGVKDVPTGNIAGKIVGGVGLLVVAPAPDVPSGVGAQPRVSLPKVAILWGFTGAAALERSDARWTPGASSRNVSERPASPSQHRCPGAPRTSALHP